MCENSCINKIGKRCNFDIKQQGINETSIRCPKHCEFYTPLKLIRKNPAKASLLRQRGLIKNILKFRAEVSNVSFGMKPHFYIKPAIFLKKAGTVSNGCVFLFNIFSSQEAYVGCCRRIYRKFFCTFNISTNLSFDSRTKDIIDVKKRSSIPNFTKNLIINSDFKKGLTTNDSSTGIIRKLTTFKINKCGKYINITKELLCNPDFFRLAYNKIKSNKKVNIKIINNGTLNEISFAWFYRATNLIKNSQYKFKPARMKDISKVNINEKRIITITNIRDNIIQKAIALILEIIYERDKIFLEFSHGFRPHKGCHTALKQIKCE